MLQFTMTFYVPYQILKSQLSNVIEFGWVSVIIVVEIEILIF